MKFTKLLKVFAKSAIALTFAAFAFSCANVSDASVSDSSTKTRTLNIGVANYADYVEAVNSISANKVATSSASRTIIADSYNLNGTTLYLYGTATNGATFGPEKVTATKTDGTAISDATSVGKIAIPTDVGSYTWELTLALTESEVTLSSSTYAEKVADLLKSAVLLGSSTVDIANNDTANFTLSPDGLTKTAAIAMTLSLSSDWGTGVIDNYNTTAGIYDLLKGEVIKDSAETPASTERTYNGTYTTGDLAKLSATAPGTANYNVTDGVAPGTYLFKVTFENSTTKKVFTWSDVIIVLPGKTISNSIVIPNVIGIKPETPASFVAGYVNSSEDKYAGFYTVDFEWTRPTNKNENYYEIDVLEYAVADSATAPTSDDNWSGIVSPSTGSATGTSTTYAGVSEAYATTVSTDDAKVYSFVASDVYESGSLLGGNKTAQFRLELGKRYFARIRAVNDAGSSDYKYLAISSSDTFTTSGAKTFTSTTINRYRISYNVNGGNYYTSTSSITEKPSSGEKSDNILKYFCENATDGNAVIQGNGTTAYKETSDASGDYYYYTKGDSIWKYWNYYKDGAATRFATTTDDVTTNDTVYKGYANLDLYADYSGSASVEIDDKSAYKILRSWISLAIATDSTSNISSATLAEDSSNVGTTATITYSDTYTSTSKQNVTWSFKPLVDYDSSSNPTGKITSDFTFDKVNFTVSKGGVTYTSQEAEDVKAGTSGSSSETFGTTFTQDLSTLSSGVYNVLFTAHTGTTTVSYPITLTIQK